MLLKHYEDYLPVTASTPDLSLGEGSTPLLHARRLGALLGCPHLYLKVEGMNPTGSFKDRGMVLTMAKAAEEEAIGVICASTGNTAASAGAYAAATGLHCTAILPSGSVAEGKLSQAAAYGVEVISILGSFDQALSLAKEVGQRQGYRLVNSLNPLRIEGQKTGAFEVCDALGRAPDIVALPVGNGGNITSYWRGFVEYKARGRMDTTPEMWGFQAAGAAPLVSRKLVARPETVATAIRIGDPARGREALEATDLSHGMMRAVTDDEIWMRTAWLPNVRA